MNIFQRELPFFWRLQSGKTLLCQQVLPSRAMNIVVGGTPAKIIKSINQ